MKQLFNFKVRTNNPKRQWLEKDYPGFLHLIFMQGIQAGTIEQIKKYKFGFGRGYTINSGDRLDWFWDLRDLERVRKLFLQRAKTRLSFFLKIYARWETDYQSAMRQLFEMEKQDFSKMGDKKLYDSYHRLYATHVRQGAHSYLVDAFLTTGDTDWLGEFIFRRLKKGSDKAKAVEVLTAPTIPSYSNEEDISLTAIAKTMRHNVTSLKNFTRLIQRNKKLKRKISAHAKKFFWVESNYYPKIVSEKEFINKLYGKIKAGNYREILTILKQNKFAQERELARHNDPYLRRVITMSAMATHMQDYRKMALVRFSHTMHRVFEEMAKRTGLTLNDFRNTIEPELSELFLKRAIDRKKLRLRAKKNFACGLGENYAIYEGGDLTRYVDEGEFKTLNTSHKVIKGVCACPGLVTGTVRIIRDARNARHFKAGEILVTNNTTPEFVPLIKKAAAVITEQGGITTHAAIVSRELKKPCVIGAKDATKILKDGDRVEVDANKGIVKIL